MMANGPLTGEPRIQVGCLNFDPLLVEHAAEHIANSANAGRGGLVVTPNIDFLYRANRDATFRALVSEAELSLADGQPVVWAARLQGTPLPGRASGSDLLEPLCSSLARRGLSLFLLGGNPGTAERAGALLASRHVGLRIVGTRCPPFGFEHDPIYMAELKSTLITTSPHVVLVGLGSPKQENLSLALRNICPQTWWVGVGVSFSFVSGDISRAPMLLRTMGLEWAYRLMREPRHLFGRYLQRNLPFALWLLLCAAFSRTSRRKPTVGEPPF